MHAHHQLLMWVLIISALNFVLLHRLRDSSTTAYLRANNARADLTQMDFVDAFEPDVLNLRQTVNEKSTHDNLLEETTAGNGRGASELSSSSSNLSTVPMRTYYVRKDDTLWKIARTNDVDLKTLLSANNLKNPDLIYIGQAINIPSQDALIRSR